MDQLIAQKAVLVRLPGGFWTYQGCPTNDRGVPAWWVSTGTVQSMEAKGRLQRTGRYPEAWRDDRTLVL